MVRSVCAQCSYDHTTYMLLGLLHSPLLARRLWMGLWGTGALSHHFEHHLLSFALQLEALLQATGLLAFHPCWTCSSCRLDAHCK